MVGVVLSIALTLYGYVVGHYRTIIRKWDDATQDLALSVIGQAGPSGRRYAQFSARTMRSLATTTPQFTSGNLDIRTLVAPAS